MIQNPLTTPIGREKNLWMHNVAGKASKPYKRLKMEVILLCSLLKLKPIRIAEVLKHKQFSSYFWSHHCVVNCSTLLNISFTEKNLHCLLTRTVSCKGCDLTCANIT